jgi:hypothetical protein
MVVAESTRLDASPSFTNVDTWVDEALKEPDSFAMHNDDPKWFTTWSLGPVFKTRDSDNIQEANAIALIKHLESDPSLNNDWDIIGCSHWAVGHVDHLAFKVIERVGKATPKSTELAYHYPLSSRPGYRLTRIARVLKQWFDNLAEYPVADDEELSRIEFEASLEAIQSQSPPRGRELLDKLPEDWANQVYDVMGRDGSISTEGQGAWADEERLEQTLDSLGFLQPKDEA